MSAVIMTTGGRSSPPTSPSALIESVGRDRDEPGLDDAIEAQERATEVARARTMLLAAVPLWVLSALTADVAGALWINERSPWPLLVVRLAVTVVEIGVILWLGRQREAPSRRALVAMRWTAFLTPCVGIGLCALDLGSITTPFGSGIICVLAASGLSVPDRASRAAPLLTAMALTYPLVVVGGGAFQPEIAAQLADPQARAIFTEICLSQGVAALLVGAGGHAYWRTRRSLLIAQRRARYRLVERIGEGAMGEVWRAWHPGLGQDVAMKILKQSGDERSVARFEQEIRATAELTHPHTVRVYDCGTTAEGLWYYTMELLTGETVRELVRRVGPLPVERVVYLGIQAARALGEAHQRGMVHRDVKPDNVFVSTCGGERDFVKLLDFGIARIAASTANLTRAGALIGTPAYMSPEQEQGGAIDARTDVYALAAVLYYALTGVPPVEGPTLAAIQLRRATRPIRRPSELRPGVPPLVDDLLLRALALDPSTRPADGADFARALEQTGQARWWSPDRAQEATLAPAASSTPADATWRSEVDAGANATLALPEETLPPGRVRPG